MRSHVFTCALHYARNDRTGYWTPDHHSWNERNYSMDRRIGRRKVLTFGGLGLTVLAGAGWRSRSIALAGTVPASDAPLPSSVRASSAACVLSPEQTQGPYYIPKEKVRSNIVEHRSGVSLKLRLTVVDAVRCAPIMGAAVDIWHCNAGGIYSGFESASAGGPGGNAGPTDKDTFLRGIQYTDARGLVQFQTIYPGWYRGRTVHIHVVVHVGGSIVHTGQLYFDDTLTDKVYQTGPYKARAADRDTRNATDGIYANGGPRSTLSMKRAAGGYIGAITLGVRSV
jgi:protocatechuate 3,4-dioxygenase beta subunit